MCDVPAEALVTRSTRTRHQPLRRPHRVLNRHRRQPGAESHVDHQPALGKNRRDIDGSSCFGIDLKQNWGHQWDCERSRATSARLYGDVGLSSPRPRRWRFRRRPTGFASHDMHPTGSSAPHWATRARRPAPRDYEALGGDGPAHTPSGRRRPRPRTPRSTRQRHCQGLGVGRRERLQFVFGSRHRLHTPPDQISPLREILQAAIHLAAWILRPFAGSIASSVDGAGSGEAREIPVVLSPR